MPGSKPAWKRLWTRLAPVAPAAPAEPLVSVVVPVFNVAGYLGECLDSLLAQDHRNLQVLVVDDGSTDASAAIAQRYANADNRIEFLRQANAGLGATRNRAAGLARGEFLFFLDSDDRLPKRAISTLVEAAQRTGADVAMGPLARFNSSRRWVPRWATDLHPAPEFLSSLADRPGLLRNHYAAGKLYRKAFWDRIGAAFREGVRYEDQPLLTQLLIEARGIACLPDPVYEYREREDNSAIHQQIHTMADLNDRALAWQAAVELLRPAPAAIRAAWLQTILGTHVHYYLDSEGIENPAYWAALRDAVRPLAELGRPDGWISPAQRLALELLGADQQEEYLRLRQAGAFAKDRQRYVVEDGTIRWRPVMEAGAAALDVEVQGSAPPARIRLLQASWMPSGGLVLAGQHHLPGLDLTGRDVRHHVEVRGPAGLVSVVPAVMWTCPGAPSEDKVRGVDLTAGGFRAVVPPAALLGASPGPIQFAVVSSFDGLERRDPLPVGTRWFPATRLGIGVFQGRTFRPRTEAGILLLDESDITVWVEDLEQSEEAVRLRLGHAAGVQLASVAIGDDDPVPVTDGRAVFTAADLRSQRAVPAGTQLPVTVTLGDGSSVPLVGAHSSGPVLERLQLAPDGDAMMRFLAHRLRPELVDLTLRDDELTFSLRFFRSAEVILTSVRLASRRAVVEAATTGDDRWRVPLAGLEEGGYDLVVEAEEAGRSRRSRVAVGAGLLPLLPLAHQVGLLRWRALVSSAGWAHIDAHPAEPGGTG